MNIREGQLIEFNPQNIDAFDEFTSQLAELAKLNSSAVFDYESSQGNKEARSHIHNLRKTKSAVDQKRKAAKQNALEYGRAVDAKAKDIIGQIEGMIAVHLEPIQEIERIEERRQADIKAKLDWLEDAGNVSGLGGSEQIKERLQSVLAWPVGDDLEEFKAQAIFTKTEVIKRLKEALKKQVVYEAEQAELEQLRRGKAERDEADRIEAIRRDAAEKARIQAEQKAAQERKREDEERERQEAEERRKKELAEAQERDRLAEIEKKKQDKAHRAKINRAVVESLIACGVDKSQAKLVVTAAGAGSVDHLIIKY